MFYIIEGWKGFCGGMILWHFSEVAATPEHMEAVGTTAPQKLLSIAAELEEASFVMADCIGGVADEAIFEELASTRGTIEGAEEYTLHYTLSPFFYNPNSGNDCRVLFVWKEYKQAFFDRKEREREEEAIEDDEEY